MIRLLPVFFLLTACAGAPPAAPVDPAVDGTARAASPDAEAPASVETPEATGMGVTTPAVTPASVAPVEPPRGELKAATATLHAAGDAVLVDLRTDGGWPGEAMDPTLAIGEERFTDYTHPDPITLRFTVPAAAVQPAGQAAVVRYGERVVAELTLPPVSEEGR